MRSWLGLAPKPVTSCSDAAAAGRAGAATSSAIAASRGTTPRAIVSSVFLGMGGPPVRESRIHMSLCAGRIVASGVARFGARAEGRRIVPGGELLNRESSGGQGAQDPLDDLGGTRGWLRLDAQAFHRLGVVVDVVAFVEVERAGELLDVDDVGQVLVREAQDGEGSAGRGVATGPERDDLQAHVGQLG